MTSVQAQTIKCQLMIACDAIQLTSTERGRRGLGFCKMSCWPKHNCLSLGVSQGRGGRQRTCSEGI